MWVLLEYQVQNSIVVTMGPQGNITSMIIAIPHLKFEMWGHPAVGLDMTAKLVHRIPPPLFWMQIPCFLEVTGRVALQNIENNEVPCKIFLAKELWAVLASVGRFQLSGGAKRTCRDDVCRKTSGIIVHEVGK
jgi:hypothetical protein